MKTKKRKMRAIYIEINIYNMKRNISGGRWRIL